MCIIYNLKSNTFQLIEKTMFEALREKLGIVPRVWHRSDSDSEICKEQHFCHFLKGGQITAVVSSKVATHLAS